MFDFTILQSRLELRDVEQTVVVLLYSKDGDKYIMHANTEVVDCVGHLEMHKAKGDVGEMFYTDGHLLVSIGSPNEDAFVVRTNVMKAAAGIHKIIFDKSEVIFAETPYNEDAIYAFALSSYCYDFLKEKKGKCKSFLLNAPFYERAIKRAHAQNFARFLGDTPANMMTPGLFVEYAKQFLSSVNTAVEVYDKKFMGQNNMNLILSVSQGSAQEPKLLHVRYNGSPEEKLHVALVGKGVTFDTGGTSIKPSAGMAAMKYDMMGAATLLGAFKAAAELKLNMNMTATFPLVENMPGSRATKPGDVFTSMSGKTVEVDNTDAEGRLILADALTFAQLAKPEYLLDAATLTGAMHVALGNVYGGFFANDDGLAALIQESAAAAHEPLWRMPLSPYYRETLKSHVADINNMGGQGAGSAKAAEFLQAFVDKGVKWAHFDIAGLMNKSYNKSLYGEESTGRPVPAFIEILERLAK